MVIIAGSHRKKQKKIAAAAETVGQQAQPPQRMFSKGNVRAFMLPDPEIAQNLKKRAYKDRLYVVPLPFLQAVDERRCLFFAGGLETEDGTGMLVCGCIRAKEAKYPYCAHHFSLARAKRLNDARSA